MDDAMRYTNDISWAEDDIGAMRTLGAVDSVAAAEGMRNVIDQLKETNPKDALGSDKMPLHLWPQTATMMGCMGLLNGMLKYGRNNYRALGVKSSIYYDACKRHLEAWFEGEEYDEDGVPNLGAALACLAIIVDAQAAGKLQDDRMYPGGYFKLKEELTPLVKVLKERHKDKDPHHYTCQDQKG